MALSPIQLKPKQSGGKGGLWGTVIGGGLGAIAAPFTGGSSIGAGMALGGAVGGAVDPAKQSGGRGVSTLDTAAKMSPGVQKRQLLDIMEEVKMSPELDEQKKRDVEAMFNPAIDVLSRRG
jgi:hypothetical protein